MLPAMSYGELNDWWRGQFPDPAQAPAGLTFQAAALPFEAKIELQAVTARGLSVPAAALDDRIVLPGVTIDCGRMARG
jgi:hypothetical protein